MINDCANVNYESVKEFINIIRNSAGVDKREDIDIYKLTVDIAVNAGYKREMYDFPYGGSRVRTSYTNSFDNRMCSKWLYYFEPMFLHALKHHSKTLRGSFCEVVYRTMVSFFNSLNLEKVVNDSTVRTMAKKTLTSRIYDLYKLQNGKKVKLIHEYIPDITEYLEEREITNSYCGDLTYNDEGLDDTLVSIRMRLEDNPMGYKVLDCLLNNGYVKFKRIDDYIDIEDFEKTNQTIEYIKSAYRVIVEELAESLGRSSKSRRTPSVGFSKGVKCSI